MTAETVDLIATLRAALREELGIPTTVRSVPGQTEVVAGEAVVDSGELGGMALSVRMGKYLDANYGETFPFSAALKSLRQSCRRGHPGHTDRGIWNGSLCWRLVMWTVYWGFSVAVAARECGIDVDHAERLLARSLRDMTQHMGGHKAPPSESAPPDEYSPTRISRAICDALRRQVRDFDLEQRIWEGLRGRDPSLRSWEDEWADRQAKLLDHRATCERCRYERAA